MKIFMYQYFCFSDRRHMKKANGFASTQTRNRQFLSAAKKKLDGRKDRVKNLSVEDFE